MIDNRNLILAIVLSIAILLGSQLYFDAMRPTNSEQASIKTEELDKLCKVTEMVGAAGIPVMLPLPPEFEKTNQHSSTLGAGYFQGQYSGQLIDSEISGWEERTGRGGYAFPAYRHSATLNDERGGEYSEGVQLLWEELLKIYKALMSVAESAGVLIAQHGADPVERGRDLRVRPLAVQLAHYLIDICPKLKEFLPVGKSYE